MSQNNTIRIAISACLAGEPVRYDGSHKYIADLCAYLSSLFTLVPVCPEAAIGMGVPRAPIQLVGEPGSARALGIQAPTADFTDQLADFANDTLRAHPALDGFVVKARSPSCGLGTTPVFNKHQQQTGTGSGIFTRTLYNTDPTMPLIDETGIEYPAEMDLFILQVCIHSVFREQVLAAQDRQQALKRFDRNISNIAGLQLTSGLTVPEQPAIAVDPEKLSMQYAKQLFEQLSGHHIPGMLLTQMTGSTSAHFNSERVMQLLVRLNGA